MWCKLGVYTSLLESSCKNLIVCGVGVCSFLRLRARVMNINKLQQACIISRRIHDLQTRCNDLMVASVVVVLSS